MSPWRHSRHFLRVCCDYTRRVGLNLCVNQCKYCYAYVNPLSSAPRILWDRLRRPALWLTAGLPPPTYSVCNIFHGQALTFRCLLLWPLEIGCLWVHLSTSLVTGITNCLSIYSNLSLSVNVFLPACPTRKIFLSNYATYT